MASGKKQGRVAERIKQLLGLLMQFEVSDPRLDAVTILDVEVDRELMYATIYVTALGGEEIRDEVMTGLRSASGYLRRELAQRMDIRRMPELRWRWDETTEHAARIESLLDSLDIPSDDEAESTDDGAE